MNLASALTAGFATDIGVTQATINLGNQLMFLFIVVFEIPCNMLLQRVHTLSPEPRCINTWTDSKLMLNHRLGRASGYPDKSSPSDSSPRYRSLCATGPVSSSPEASWGWPSPPTSREPYTHCLRGIGRRNWPNGSPYSSLACSQGMRYHPFSPLGSSSWMGGRASRRGNGYF